MASEMSRLLFWVFLLGGLGGAALCLFLLWMLRQQKFLNELFHTLRNLERQNREAQRDLFLILRSHLGALDIPTNGHARATQGEEPENREKVHGLTLDEVKLLVALSRAGGTKPASLGGILKGVKGLIQPEAKLRSLREKGYVFYSDVSEAVVILPKGQNYLGLLRN